MNSKLESDKQPEIDKRKQRMEQIRNKHLQRGLLSVVDINPTTVDVKPSQDDPETLAASKREKRLAEIKERQAKRQTDKAKERKDDLRPGPLSIPPLTNSLKPEMVVSNIPDSNALNLNVQSIINNDLESSKDNSRSARNGQEKSVGGRSPDKFSKMAEFKRKKDAKAERDKVKM